jgi:hypothetical protein
MKCQGPRDPKLAQRAYLVSKKKSYRFPSRLGGFLFAALLVVVGLSLGASGAIAQANLTFSPAKVNFGNVAVDGSATIVVTLTNSGKSAALLYGEGLFASQFAVVGLKTPITLAPAKSITLSVEFKPMFVGPATGSLNVFSNASDRHAVLSVSGTGVNAGLSANPASASFGSVPVGISNSQTIQLANIGSASAVISAATVSAGAGFTISGLTVPLTLSAGKTATFNVVFSPKTDGTVGGFISIASTLSTVKVAVSGTGVTGTRSISASVASWNFGNVNVGSSGSGSVLLTNTGNSSVTISGLAFSGAGVSASGVANGTILNSGQTATLTMKFAPLAAGSVTGSVSVTSNATVSPTKIAVSGTGVASAGHSVKLGWAASTTSGVIGYNVYRSTVSGGPYTKLNSAPISALQYTDTSVQAGLEYFYVLTSVESSGLEGSYSSQIAASIP